ncbi:MAG TPA: GAF domain-containing protein [Advenella sp.]|nr:GAF domain-containing protein [Advenella sp.]
MFSFDHSSGFESVPAMYDTLVSQARSLFDGEPSHIANAANLAALVYHTVPDLNWAGFYFYDGNELVLGPFQGKIACVRIPIGKGVCGTAAATGQAQLVPDVFAFPGHIACDAASRSEIVIPLFRDGRLVGVWDVDSPSPQRFTLADQAGMQALCQVWLDACGSAGAQPAAGFMHR